MRIQDKKTVCKTLKKKLRQLFLLKGDFYVAFESEDFGQAKKLKRELEDIIYEIRELSSFDPQKIFNQFIQAILDKDILENDKNDTYKIGIRQKFLQLVEVDEEKRTFTIRTNYLDLSGRKWDFELPNNINFELPNGVLDLKNSDISKLPRALRVAGHLDIYSTKITELPKDLVVTGVLFIAKDLEEQAIVLKNKGQIHDYQIL